MKETRSVETAAVRLRRRFQPIFLALSLLGLAAAASQPPTLAFAGSTRYDELHTQALTAARAGDHAKAAQLLTEAIAAYDGSSPDDLTHMRLNLSAAYRHLGQNEKADQILRELAAEVQARAVRKQPPGSSGQKQP